MCVSENRGTPKSSILIGFSIRNHPFWGTPIFGNTHLYVTRKKADKRAWNFLQQIVLVLGVGNSSCWVFICETCPWFRSMELWFKSMTRNGRHTPAEKYKPTHPEPENEKFCFGNVSKMKHTKFSRGWLLDIWLFRAPGASSEPVSKTTWRCWKQFHDKFQPPVHTKSTQLESTNRSKIWSLSKNIEDKIFLFFLRWFLFGGRNNWNHHRPNSSSWKKTDSSLILPSNLGYPSQSSTASFPLQKWWDWNLEDDPSFPIGLER